MTYWRYTFSIGFLLIGATITMILILIGIGFYLIGMIVPAIKVGVVWLGIMKGYLIMNYVRWKRYKNFNT